MAAGGLLAGTIGTASRLVASFGSLVVLATGIQVGAAGGDLVYKYGAAEAYAQESATAPARSWEPVEHEER